MGKSSACKGKGGAGRRRKNPSCYGGYA